MDSRQYLSDKKFLFELHKQKLREIYARITSLNIDENPIEQIQGKVTSGSINIDGNSAIRRSCSLTIAMENMEITDYAWTLKTKFFLEIGIKNDINDKYPEIIWMPQGVYVISSFSTSLNSKSLNINISGKDKMCLLNGEMGGTIQELNPNIGIIDEYDEITGVTSTRDLTIREILISLLTEYGKERLENIFISDLEDYGRELMEYQGEDDIFLYSDVVEDQNLFSHNYINLAFIDTVIPGSRINFGSIDTIIDQGTSTEPKLSKYYDDLDMYYKCTYSNGTVRQIKKLSYGDVAGYQITELTYPGELILNQGSTVTAALDKIKNMLINFEYFYNEYGKFIFQKKQIFKNSTWNSINEKVPIAADYSDVDFELMDFSLIQNFSSTPSLSNVKNDYSIWGTKTGVDKNKAIPIHIRFAIDKKPEKYVSVIDDSKGNYKTYTTEDYDWRELIYQMATDSYKMAWRDQYEFNRKLVDRNPHMNIVNGKTGYEQYYIDMRSFWRDLYDPDNMEKNYELISNPKISMKNYLYSKQYFKYNKNAVDEDSGKKKIQLFLESEDMDYFKLKVFKHDGFQNFLDTLETYKQLPNGSYKNYYIDDKKIRLLNLGRQVMEILDITKYGERNILYLIKNGSSKILNVFGKETLPAIYRKNGKTYTVVKFENIKDNAIEHFYYLEGNTYKSVLDLLISLGESGTLYLKTDKNNKVNIVEAGVTPKGNEDIPVAYAYGDKALNNRQKITYYDSTDKKCYPWWRLYSTDTFSQGIYYEAPWDDSEALEEYASILKNTLMERIYITEQNTLRKNFKKYDFDINGKAIVSSKKLIDVYYYKAIDKYWKYGKKNKYSYWNKNVTRNPESLNFWIDFLDPSDNSGVGAELDKFSIPAIGVRPFVLNDGENSNSVFYTKIPDVIIHTFSEKEELKKWKERFPGHSFIKVQDYTKELFSQSTRKKSLQETLDEQLFKYSYCPDNVSIGIIPLYYLQPNIKILLEDKTTKVSGIYELSKFNLPMAANGTSSFTLSKYVEQLY